VIRTAGPREDKRRKNGVDINIEKVTII